VWCSLTGVFACIPSPSVTIVSTNNTGRTALIVFARICDRSNVPVRFARVEREIARPRQIRHVVSVDKVGREGITMHGPPLGRKVVPISETSFLVVDANSIVRSCSPFDL